MVEGTIDEPLIYGMIAARRGENGCFVKFSRLVEEMINLIALS